MLRLISISALLVYVFCSCSFDSTADKRTDTSATALQIMDERFAALEAAKMQWQSRQSEMKGYRQWVSIGCQCSTAGHYYLVVREGEPNRLEDAGDGLPREERFAEQIRSFDIEGLFMRVENALNNKADVVSVLYDFSYGYPLAIQINPDLHVIDDEFEILTEIRTFPRIQ